MHRYIDSDKFHRKLYAIKTLSHDGFQWVRRGETADIAEKLSTADVQEVVHCKDCIHRDPEDKKRDGVFCAKNGLLPMDDNDYCSYGERK